MFAFILLRYSRRSMWGFCVTVEYKALSFIVKREMWFDSGLSERPVFITNYHYPTCQDYPSFALTYTPSSCVSRTGSEHSRWTTHISCAILLGVGWDEFVQYSSHMEPPICDAATPCQRQSSPYFHCSARNVLVSFAISLDEQKYLIWIRLVSCTVKWQERGS